MTLTFGNIRIGTNQLYLVLVILMLFTDMLFYGLLIGSRGSEGEGGKGPEKQLIVTAILFSLLTFGLQNRFLKRWGLVGFAFLFYLVLESFYNYSQPVVYPHVFSKALVIFLVLFLYPFFNGNNPNQLSRICALLTIVFFIYLIFFKSEILSIGSFVSRERGFPSSSVYLLLLPCLLCFNRYLRYKSFFYLSGFFVLMFFIFFLQHRTVWIATAVAIVVNLVLIKTKSSIKVRLATFVPILAIPAFLVFAASTLIIAHNPEFVNQLVKLVDDIQNIDKQGTGSWRLEQFASYWPYIQQNIVAGMRFEGFELPIQFYQNDETIWQDGTGHHFHSWYVDRLFYFGVLGMVYTLLPILYLLYRMYRKREFSNDQLVMCSFVVSGISYGTSYDWPLFFYAMIGIAIAYMDREEEDPVEEGEVTQESYLMVNRETVEGDAVR